MQQRTSLYAYKHKYTTVTHYTVTRRKWVVSIQLASIPIILFPCIGMQILKNPPHLTLLMPEIYYAKMANMAAYSEEKHGLILVTFPRYLIGSMAKQRRIVHFVWTSIYTDRQAGGRPGLM
jgi:hypothetical protein